MKLGLVVVLKSVLVFHMRVTITHTVMKMEGLDFNEIRAVLESKEGPYEIFDS